MCTQNCTLLYFVPYYRLYSVLYSGLYFTVLCIMLYCILCHTRYSTLYYTLHHTWHRILLCVILSNVLSPVLCVILMTEQCVHVCSTLRCGHDTMGLIMLRALLPGGLHTYKSNTSADTHKVPFHCRKVCCQTWVAAGAAWEMRRVHSGEKRMACRMETRRLRAQRSPQ